MYIKIFGQKMGELYFIVVQKVSWTFAIAFLVYISDNLLENYV